ncbi:hypothetical protein Goklo_028001, partial [Gossypium klotzschianum]|nr:hypothetical protein [Gossypium klotzschianum]
MRSGRIQSSTWYSASSSSTFPHPPYLTSASRHCRLSISQRVSRISLLSSCSSGLSKTQLSVSTQRNEQNLLSVGVGAEALVTSNAPGVSNEPLVAEEKIGVLLLNLGGPENLEDVQPFLFNLFADPVVFVIVLRYHYPFQAEELRKSLWAKNVPAKVYIGMRYWHPFTEEAIEQVVIFFSAHGVPLAYVEEAGDPYKAEMEECVDLIIQELEKRKITNAYTLAYQ